uniref:Uncharacterized protein n=1 Tax=Pseudo-nitzschia australis TaxID=44445 RepID=A0A7S4EQ76_9STRA
MARVPLGLGGSSGTIRSSDNDDDNDSAKYSWVVASSTTTTSRGSKPAVGARDDHGSVSIEQYMYDIAGTTSETAVCSDRFESGFPSRSGRRNAPTLSPQLSTARIQSRGKHRRYYS